MINLTRLFEYLKGNPFSIKDYRKMKSPKSLFETLFDKAEKDFEK
jgi:hypothetical protein